MDVEPVVTEVGATGVVCNAPQTRMLSTMPLINCDWGRTA
jgi:hypothetical protein